MEDVIKISKEKLPCIQFDDLKIHDYTAGLNTDVSLATIIVPPEKDHKKHYQKDQINIILSFREKLSFKLAMKNTNSIKVISSLFQKDKVFHM